MKAKSYCIVFGCLNNDKDRSLSFFSLPRDAERRRKWLTLVDRQDLLKTENIGKFTSHRVCSAHFEDSSIKLIKNLKENAVPTMLLPNQSQECSQSCSDSEDSEAPSTSTQIKSEVIILSNNTKYFTVGTQTESLQPTEEQTRTSQSLTAGTPRKRKLSDELCEYKLKHPRLDEDVMKMRKELEANNKSTTCNDPDDEIGRRFQKLIDWQNKLKYKSKGNRYDAQDTVFALNLLYSSPHAYRCLQTILKLPCKNTLNRFKMDIPPKFDSQVLDSLAFKINSLPDAAKHCTICVGEMSVKRNLCHNVKTDEVIGFHNINGKISPEIASNAFVIMLQGICFKWKQPIAYALLPSAKHYEQIDLWLNEVITKLLAIGIKVRAIVSDQGSYFDKFAKEVKKVTAEKPYFMFDDNTRIYYIFDVPHLIKCIRNNLLARDLLHDGKKISWDYIGQLYKHQKENKLRLIPKITNAHIQPNNLQRMRVQLAVQTLSRTVSAALHTYIDLGKISEEARPTAAFIESMNNLFDVLNSSKIKSCNEFQTAFRLSKDQENVLNDAKGMFAATQAVNRKTGKNNTGHIKSFVNFQISIQSIKMLYEDLKIDGFEYLLTRRLNRDNLQNVFGSIRKQSGSGREPTPIQFRRAFSSLFFCNMIKTPPYANCEIDVCDALRRAEDIMKTTLLGTDLPPQKSAVYLRGETDYRMELPDENTLTYVSGYLFYKCINEHMCPDLNEVLKSLPELGDTHLFTRYKAYNRTSGFYGALKMPPEEFTEYVQNLETAFTHYFYKLIRNNPGGELLKLFRTIPPQIPCPCFPVNYLLKLYVRFRIFETIKFNNRQFRNGKKGIKTLCSC